MTINVSDNTPRNEYTVAEGVASTPFAIDFEFYDNSDVVVYKNSSLINSANYTISGGDGSTGTLTYSFTGGVGGDTVTIIRDIALERTTDFPSQGAFQISSLNTELDRFTAIASDIDALTSRSLRLEPYDTTVSLTLPNATSRANNVLAFASDGSPVATTAIGNYKGNWAAQQSYNERDIVKDTSTNNIFIAITAHQSSGSQPLTTNTDSAKWALIVDAASATTSATNAATSESNAADSETNAAASESNAATSESNASSSATTASNAATAAQAARDAAFEAYENFDDRYLGSMSDSQTQDTQVTTGDWTLGQSVVTVADATGIVAGMVVTGVGMPSETNVISVDGTTVIVNNATTVAGSTTSLTFTGYGVLGNFDGTKDGPATDNDNNTLVGGQLYYNSTDNEMRLYNGTSWVAAYVSGGDFLAIAGGTMTGNIHYGDNVKATFGDSGTPDLELYHNGSHSFLQDKGTGDFYIDGSRVRLRQVSSANMFLVADTSGVDIYDGAGSLAFATSANELNCSKRIRGVNAKELSASVTSSSNTTTCDTTTATYFYTTLTENTTFAFSNPDATDTTTIVLEIKQDASASGFTVGWPAAVKWAGGTAPTLSAGANDVDLLTFITRDQGTTWYGFVSGLDMS